MRLKDLCGGHKRSLCFVLIPVQEVTSVKWLNITAKFLGERESWRKSLLWFFVGSLPFSEPFSPCFWSLLTSGIFLLDQYFAPLPSPCYIALSTLSMSPGAVCFLPKVQDSGTQTDGSCSWEELFLALLRRVFLPKKQIIWMKSSLQKGLNLNELEIMKLSVG